MPKYPNLEAEIARNGFKKKLLADMLGVTPATITNKLTKGEYDFKMVEAMAIQQELFPDMTMDYLFERGG